VLPSDEFLLDSLLLVRFVDEFFAFCYRDLHALVVVGMDEDELLELRVCWRYEEVIAGKVLANQLEQDLVVLGFQATATVA
jgi:hypothetical protein